MSGNLVGHGAADLLRKKDALEARYKRAEGRMKHARGLLKALALGLMLACGTAYAAEPPSPAPATMTKNKVNQADAIPNLASSHVGDWITDGTIALFIILMAMFFSVNFLDSRKKDKK